MAVYNSHNTKQWEELLNAINGGDTSAIATALDTIKTSIDSITTSLGNLSIDVEQDSTQWTNLITAISQGGGGVGNVTIDSTQWTNLITAINTGDTSAIATALTNIKSSVDNIYSRLNSIGFNTTQWTNLINSISNQSLTVDLNNLNSDNVRNLSNITGSNLTSALNRISYNSQWKLVAEVDIPTTANTDILIPKNFPFADANITDIMFILLRKSNMRVFASASCPFDIWKKYALYASGTYILYSGAMGNNLNLFVNAVCIDSNNQMEIAVNRPSETLIARVYIKGIN